MLFRDPGILGLRDPVRSPIEMLTEAGPAIAQHILDNWLVALIMPGSRAGGDIMQM
jgi:hypothetical protein